MGRQLRPLPGVPLGDEVDLSGTFQRTHTSGTSASGNGGAFATASQSATDFSRTPTRLRPLPPEAGSGRWFPESDGHPMLPNQCALSSVVSVPGANDAAQPDRPGQLPSGRAARLVIEAGAKDGVSAVVYNGAVEPDAGESSRGADLRRGPGSTLLGEEPKPTPAGARESEVTPTATPRSVVRGVARARLPVPAAP
jgi:hypothetical protein